MLALGADVLRAILEGFWSQVAPEQYTSSEAEAFAGYLESLDLQVPHLAEVLRFERAIVATLLDDQPRVVTFAFNPLPLLRALAEGHLPDQAGQPGDFEIELTPGSSLSASGLGIESAQQVFPFH
jgi:hypothetical protein